LTIRRAAARAVLIFLAVSPLAACAKFVQVQETDLLRKTAVRRIALLPFESDLYVKRTGTERSPTVTCLYDGKIFPRARVPEAALAEVTAIFLQQLSLKGGYDIVRPGDVEALIARRHLDPKAMEPPAFFGPMAEELGADAVLAGNVLLYDELHGSAYAAKASAAVVMDVHLVDARTGKLLWQASYAETQATLSDNVGGIGSFVQRGARFLTAHQLADWAAGQILERFPKPRPPRDEAVPPSPVPPGSPP
jgi:hypothetical protein